MSNIKVRKHLVTENRWCHAVKFLLGMGAGKYPLLTDDEQKQLVSVMRGPYKNGFHTATQAQAILLELGWERKWQKETANAT